MRPLPAMSSRIRTQVLEQSFRAGVGHIGSALSIADILAVLFDGVLQGTGADRERFVLSKGHAVLGLYAALHETGRIDAATLDTFCGEGTALGAPPEHTVEGIDFSTGSLGQGLSIAAGVALAARIQGSRRRTFALLSDAELNEGSVWEAVMFAAQQRLGSLVAIVDVNRQQALGYTRDVLDLEPLDARFASFGWTVQTLDGHNVAGMRSAIDGLALGQGRPNVLLARTTFGRGVSFMESQVAWHYWPLSQEQYRQAMQELRSAEDPADHLARAR